MHTDTCTDPCTYIQITYLDGCLCRFLLLCRCICLHFRVSVRCSALPFLLHHRFGLINLHGGGRIGLFGPRVYPPPPHPVTLRCAFLVVRNSPRTPEHLLLQLPGLPLCEGRPGAHLLQYCMESCTHVRASKFVSLGAWLQLSLEHRRYTEGAVTDVDGAPRMVTGGHHGHDACIRYV